MKVVQNSNYYKTKEGTNIKFSCGKVLKFELAFGIMDNQILRATKLESVLRKRINPAD